MLSMIASLGKPPLIGPVVPVSFRISQGPQRNGAVIEKATTTTTKITTGRMSPAVGLMSKAEPFWTAPIATRSAAWTSPLATVWFDMVSLVHGLPVL